MARDILATPQGEGEPKESSDLSNFSLGYNGYTSPYLLGPAQWKAASNVYSGQFGTVRRARFANIIVDGTTSGISLQSARFASLYPFRDPSKDNVILGDIGHKLFVFDGNSSYGATQRINPMNSDEAMGSNLAPWQRSQMVNMVFEMNGAVKQKGRSTLCNTIENWGLDSPDASPSVTLAGGGITVTVGRSYRFAWENNNTSHIGGPSPATSYIAYSSQQGTIDCIQAGTLQASTASTAVVGTGTAFTPAWIGRYLWIQGLGGSVNQRVITVTDATHLTVATAITISGGSKFQIYDPQATHIRLYATGDGGATYFRIQRNAWTPANTTLATFGGEFVDNSNSEPPNSPFTTETAMFFNLPPPIGTYVSDYQTRLVIWGVPGLSQSLFYSNIEQTVFGNPPESFAPLNQITFPIGDAQVFGTAALPSGLVVWSDKHDMFKITGLLTDNTVTGSLQLSATIQRLPYDLGIGAPRASVVTPVGVIWLTSDYEIRLYNDVHATRNIGRPVQDILNRINPSQLSNARMSFYHRKDKSWVVLAIAVDTSAVNNKLLILDVELLSSNGSPSFFLFDMATNQPAWYVFDIEADSLSAAWDQNLQQRLLVGQLDQVTDADYDGINFKQGAELNVFGATGDNRSNATVTLHAIGNDSATFLKAVDFLRFITNSNPATKAVISDGWTGAVLASDDDASSVDNPQIVALQPGVNSPTADGVSTRALGFNPGKFEMKAQGNFVKCRRYNIQWNFPSQPPSAGVISWELRSILYKHKSINEV